MIPIFSRQSSKYIRNCSFFFNPEAITAILKHEMVDERFWMEENINDSTVGLKFVETRLPVCGSGRFDWYWISLGDVVSVRGVALPVYGLRWRRHPFRAAAGAPAHGPLVQVGKSSWILPSFLNRTLRMDFLSIKHRIWWVSSWFYEIEMVFLEMLFYFFLRG